MTKRITCDRCGREDDGMQETYFSDEAYDLCPKHLKEYNAVRDKSWDLAIKAYKRRALKWLNNQ